MQSYLGETKFKYRVNNRFFSVKKQTNSDYVDLVYLKNKFTKMTKRD